MKVLKFGGGCLKDANFIKKLPIILKNYINSPVFLVVSALGKTTNMLESRQYRDVINYASDIMLELDFETSVIQEVIDDHLSSEKISQKLNYPSRVCIGEYLSSDILSRYLSNMNLSNKLIDAALCIHTVTWNSKTNSAAFHSASLSDCWKNTKSKICITQGFIASDIRSKNTSFNMIRTTLGREGSDFSAAIFGALLNANEVILFKDVDGIFDKDPKIYSDANLFLKLSFDEAFQICNKRETVIHPNTLRHLQKHKIPIRIKNFNDLSKTGSLIID